MLPSQVRLGNGLFLFHSRENFTLLSIVIHLDQDWSCIQGRLVAPEPSRLDLSTNNHSRSGSSRLLPRQCGGPLQDKKSGVRDTD